MKTALFASAALALAGIALASCGKGPSTPSDFPSDAPAGITISDGRMVLPAETGDPASVYFTVTNSLDEAAMIFGVAVKGAKSATLVDPGGNELIGVGIGNGSTVEYRPGGEYVAATGLDETLAPGGTTGVTLTFAKFGDAHFPVEVLAADDAR